MPSTHRGRLKSVDDPSLELPATLTFDQDEVQIRSEGQTFGNWPLRDFDATREEANRFSLVIGGEPWSFAAEDPAVFSETSIELLADRPRRSRVKQFVRRVGSTGITVGAFSLAVATTLTAFAAGVLVGRYRLDDNVGVAAVALVVIVALSLIRISASRRLTPPPSVVAREIERRPTPVTRIVSQSNPAPRLGRAPVTLPGSLIQEREEPRPQPELSRIRTTKGDETVKIETKTYNGREELPRPSLPVSPSDAEPLVVAGPEIELDLTGNIEEIDLDLMTIKGIGPKLAHRLSGLGVHDIVELASLDEGEVAHLIESLGRYGARLVAEDWVGQARRYLHTG